MTYVNVRIIAAAALATLGLVATTPAGASDRGQGQRQRIRVTSSVTTTPVVSDSVAVVAPAVPRTGVWNLRVQRGFLGVQLVELTPELRRHFGVPRDRGLLVGRVVQASPAEAAGLRVGDILTAIEGDGVARTNDVHRQVRARADGDTIDVTLVRAGAEQRRVVTIRQRERAQLDFSPLFLAPIEGSETLFNVDPRTFNRATSRLNRLLKERDTEEVAIDARMKALERRLRQLEKRLKVKGAQPRGANKTGP